MNLMRLKILLLAAALILCSVAWGQYRFVANSRYVSIYGTRETPASTARLREMLDAGIDLIQMETGVYLEGGPEIFIVPDRASYQRLSLGRDRVVEFSDAFYSTVEHRIYIRAREQIGTDFVKVLVHEYTHWFLDQLFEGSTLWFHEGMATLYANQLSVESYLHFTQQRFFGRQSDLFQMSYEYPAKPSEWQNYYLTSYFAIRYLKEKKESGWRRFWDITAANHKNGTRTLFIRTFNASFNTTLLDFNAEFRSHCQRLAWQYLFIGFNSILLALLPFLLLFIAIKRRKRLRAMPDLPMPEGEEEPVEPDDRVESEEPEEDRVL
jgi:hypothetical protein